MLTLTIFTDHSEYFTDPSYFRSGTSMGIGALVQSVRISAECHSYTVDVVYHKVSASENDMCVATITFAPFTQEKIVSSEIKNYFSALSTRSTNRFWYTKKEISQKSFGVLRNAIVGTGMNLVFLTDRSQIRTCARASTLQDDFLWFHKELRNNMTTSFIADGDTDTKRIGMPVSTLGLGVLKYVVRQSFWVAERLQFLLRTNALISKYITYQSILHSGAVGFLVVPNQKEHQLVYTQDFDPSRRFVAGEAMQRIWLAATTEGLALQPLYEYVAMADNEDNQNISKVFSKVNLVFMKTLRELVPDSNTGMLVFAFRIGYAGTISQVRTPRKQVSDLLKEVVR